jgi:hypothetical protein
MLLSTREVVDNFVEDVKLFILVKYSMYQQHIYPVVRYQRLSDNRLCMLAKFLSGDGALMLPTRGRSS